MGVVVAPVAVTILTDLESFVSDKRATHKQEKATYAKLRETV